MLTPLPRAHHGRIALAELSIWAALVALPAACTGPSHPRDEHGLPPVAQEGGQTGGIGGDRTDRYPLGPNETSPLGFSADDAREALGGVRELPLQYADGRPATTLVWELLWSDDPSPLQYGESAAEALQVYEDWEVTNANDAVLLSAQLRFQTLDGAFDELTPPLSLQVTEGLVAQLWISRDLRDSSGNYSYPVPGGGEARKGSWNAVFKLDGRGHMQGTIELSNAEPYYSDTRRVARVDTGALTSSAQRVQDAVRACTLTVDHGPEGSLSYRCHSFEAGPGDVAFACACAGTDQAVRASECEAALESACGVGPTTPNACRDELGACHPKRDGSGFACSCADGQQASVEAARCEGALFQACARPCSRGTQRCDPAEGEIGFDCACGDGHTWRWRGASTCESLLATCEPRCSAPQGLCTLRPDHYACTCTDGSSGTVDFEASSGVCLVAAELSCGPVPAGESCEEIEDHGVTYRCSADGTGGWRCECPPAMPTPSGGADVGAHNDGSSISLLPGPAEADAKRFDGRSLTCQDALWSGC